ncbi:ExeM/NucH family extracellular endonuclease [Thiohalorhabdus sp.]|uniref:ExeM/NucH family extracellular endonuclease n=1 Tax=Thiohalorhabdus sp. TaxID=3094134 RepID=UPI002FC3945C
MAASAAALARCPEADTAAVHEVAGQVGEQLAVGSEVTVEGVVTGEFLGEDRLDGFFIQGPGLAPDGKPSGLFVYAPDLDGAAADRIEPGRRLRLRGRTGAFHGRPQLEELDGIKDCGDGKVRTVNVRLPLDRPERFEGVRVALQRPLMVTGNHELGRYGTLELAAGGRAFQPTNFPAGEGPPDSARRQRRLLLDDGSYNRQPEPIPYLNEAGTRRAGSRVAGLIGIVTRAFEEWRLHPTEPPGFREANPRPDPLRPPGPDQLRVGAFNLDNYFLAGAERGAGSAPALRRQRAKLLAASARLDADVLALMEIANRDAAVADFVKRLRRHTGEPWRRLAVEATEGAELRVALAYRRDRVSPTGNSQRDRRVVHNRPPVVAGFEPHGGGAPFAVAAVHFKSKGGCPEAGDTDRGQGCWNRRRTEQTRALTAFLKGWRREGGAPALVAGDINAYGGEDPVRALDAAGYTDLIAERLPPRRRYTFVYHGEAGYLDHLHAPGSLAERTTAVHLYPINADEPSFLAYDRGGEKDRYFAPDAFRASDHDPVVVDLLRRPPDPQP